jgi:hypothetical protein
MPASKARTQVEKPKQKLPQEKWIPFQELFTQRDAKKHSIGFRHFGQVMHDLWHFVENYHQQGIRIGNLRPWDLSIRISKGSESSYAFRLNNPDLVAKVDAQGDLVRAYSELDINFIHPEYLPLLNWDDTARLNQDWYAYGVLSYWFVTKYDPFGEGIVKAKPEADRIYRMEKAILSQSSRIETEEKKWRFIERAIGRLGTVARSYIQAFVSRKNFNREPEILLEEFRQEKILTCKAEIFKLGRNSTLRKTRSRCGFKQLTGFNYCIYCDTQHVKLLTT